MNMCKMCKNNYCGKGCWEAWDECYNCVDDYSRFTPAEEFKQHLLANGYKLHTVEKVPVIIMGFPGVDIAQVREIFKGTNVKVLDCDSSTFSKDKFPQNYIEYLEQIYKDMDIIFISAHKSVREAIKRSKLIDDCYMCICYPDKKLKSEWVAQMHKRGNNNEFCKLIEENFDAWVDAIVSDEFFYKLPIKKIDNTLLWTMRWNMAWWNLNKNVNSIFKLH